ncbi:MAG TPA: sensor histidine kinase [Solirubrobacteraceae bacterium]|nr:sensor histidine kinase [Solirubrobacteraceae bacterium]
MRQRGAWLLLFLIVAIVAFVVTLDFMSPGNIDAEWVTYVFPLAVLMSTAVGFVLATKRRENPIGWLLLVNGLVIVLSGVFTEYATYGLLTEPGALPAAEFAALANQAMWPLLFAPLAAVAFVFPDGHLPSPRWRRAVIGLGTLFALQQVLLFFAPRPLEEPFEAYSSPLPQVPEAIFNPLFGITSVAMLATLVAAALAVRTRKRRATGLERQQIKLLAYAATLIPLAVAAGWTESMISGRADTAAVAGLVAVLIAVPLAIGFAVMRYRLYEVDRLINRTLVYVTLTVLLAATYGVVSLAVGVALGGGSTLPTAAATLAVALTFGRLRAAVQQIVDRRFNRARYEGLRRVERHLLDLRAGRAAPESTGDVLAEALGDPELELLFALPDDGGYVDVNGHAATTYPEGERVVTPVRRGDLALGAVRHDPALTEQPDVLDSVIVAAGLAIEIARLRAEVRRRLAEVEESRARIVTAGYEERRRLERDLHDGAQQRLVSIGLAIRHVQGRLGAEGGEIDAELDAAVAEVTRAIEELRELARGVRPAGLDDGLAPALHELASRTPLPTEVTATTERFAEGVEAAAYFVASEALTNSVKHARASRLTVSAERRNGSLCLRISDDGIGGAVAAERSGLAGINDRVVALGGTLTVLSPRGRGTQVVAELPCGS